MYRRTFTRFIKRHHLHPFYSCFHFVYSSKLGKHPVHHLQIRQSSCILSLIIFFILPIMRKIKQSSRKSYFIQSFSHKVFLNDSQSYHTIFSPKSQAIYTRWSIRYQFLSSGNNNILTRKVTIPPLYGTCLHISTIFGQERNTGTCRSACNASQQQGQSY